MNIKKLKHCYFSSKKNWHQCTCLFLNDLDLCEILHISWAGIYVIQAILGIGIQMMLCNPVWTIGYALVTWRFFEKRIRYPYIFPLIWIFSLILYPFSSRKSVILPLIRWNCYFVSIVMIDASFLSLTSLEKDTRNSSCDSSFIRTTKSMQREYLLDYLS